MHFTNKKVLSKEKILRIKVKALEFTIKIVFILVIMINKEVTKIETSLFIL